MSKRPMPVGLKAQLVKVIQGQRDAEEMQPWRCSVCGDAVRRGRNDPCKCTMAAAEHEFVEATFAAEAAALAYENALGATSRGGELAELQNAERAAVQRRINAHAELTVLRRKPRLTQHET